MAQINDPVESKLKASSTELDELARLMFALDDDDSYLDLGEDYRKEVDEVMSWHSRLITKRCNEAQTEILHKVRYTISATMPFAKTGKTERLRIYEILDAELKRLEVRGTK